jgi:hypothetical protein
MDDVFDRLAPLVFASQVLVFRCFLFSGNFTRHIQFWTADEHLETSR